MWSHAFADIVLTPIGVDQCIMCSLRNTAAWLKENMLVVESSAKNGKNICEGQWTFKLKAAIHDKKNVKQAP